MSQSTKKIDIPILIAVIIGIVAVIALGCYLVKTVYIPANTHKITSQEEVAINIIYDFFERGIQERQMPTIEQVQLNRVFLDKENNNTLVCSSYQLYFANGNQPTWETCLETEDGSQLLNSYQQMEYVIVLTRAALLYQELQDDTSTVELPVAIIEKSINQKLALLKENQTDKIIGDIPII